MSQSQKPQPQRNENNNNSEEDPFYSIVPNEVMDFAENATSKAELHGQSLNEDQKNKLNELKKEIENRNKNNKGNYKNIDIVNLEKDIRENLSIYEANLENITYFNIMYNKLLRQIISSDLNILRFNIRNKKNEQLKEIEKSPENTDPKNKSSDKLKEIEKFMSDLTNLSNLPLNLIIFTRKMYSFLEKEYKISENYVAQINRHILQINDYNKKKNNKTEQGNNTFIIGLLNEIKKKIDTFNRTILGNNNDIELNDENKKDIRKYSQELLSITNNILNNMKEKYNKSISNILDKKEIETIRSSLASSKNLFDQKNQQIKQGQRPSSAPRRPQKPSFSKGRS